MSTVAGNLHGLGFGASAQSPGQEKSSLWKHWALAAALLGDMSFLDHLKELRSRIIKCVIAVAVGMGICTAYAASIVKFLKGPASEYGIELAGYGSMEIFSLYFHVALAGGVCLSAPVILFQVWRFIEPALYSHEKKYALPFLMSTTMFFVLGAVFGYGIAAPYIMRMQLELSALMEIPWRPGAMEYISLLTATVLAMGVVFEMPPVVFILSRIGLVNARFLLRHFKYAVLILAVASGLLTPSGDAATMMAFLAVMLGLYCLSILVAAVFGRKRRVE
jgi:sec-independent protein translocase protein TatC